VRIGRIALRGRARDALPPMSATSHREPDPGLSCGRTRDPRRAMESKPTNPTNQAQQWYSHPLFKVMRLQTKHPEAIVALGLPDFSRYRGLFEETHGGLKKLGVGLLTVRENGEVETWGF
jgi:hypothetical protein